VAASAFAKAPEDRSAQSAFAKATEDEYANVEVCKYANMETTNDFRKLEKRVGVEERNFKLHPRT
jgi:hypothetical protein